MGKKRSAEEKRTHLLKKLKKLEEKMKDSESDKATSNSASPVIHHQQDDNIELLEEPIEEIVEVPKEAVDVIDDSILEILGEAPAVEKKGQSLHIQLVDRWLDVLKNGLKKEEKDSMTKENPAFSNCRLMVPPKLNAEVSAALAETAKRRDQLIEKRQQQISTALACLGSALQLCVKEDMQLHKLKIIKHLNDATRLLCDSLHLDTKGRRSLVLSSINRDMKDYLTQTEVNDYLFGENLCEKIKTAKTVQRTGSDLKIIDNSKKPMNNKQVNPASTARKPVTNRALNWRGPPRADLRPNSAAAGGPAFSGYRRYPKKKEEKPYQRNKK